MQAREQQKPAEPAEAPQAEIKELPEERPKKNRTWLYAVIAVVALIAIYKGVQYLAYSRTHIATDNAFLDADITQVSPQVSGTVKTILVKENQNVKAGQLMVVLDDSTYVAALGQAKANLGAAIAAKQAMDADVALARRTSEGQLTQARGGV